jgi:hypothetical protein
MASAVGGVMEKHFRNHGIQASLYLSEISEAGCRVV